VNGGGPNELLAIGLRAIADHLTWVFADDWFSLRWSRVGPGFAQVGIESAATALIVTVEQGRSHTYVEIGPAGGTRDQRCTLSVASRVRGAVVLDSDLLTTAAVLFLGDHLRWFDERFAEPAARADLLARIEQAARTLAVERFGPLRPDLRPDGY
jgi:hypothetical protein